MKKEFSKNTTEVFTKTIFHYIPKILKYIDEIKDPRKKWDYSMRYLIFSEMLMFLSEGKSQRFIETAYKDTKYLENMQKYITLSELNTKTDVFSKIENTDIEDFKYKINYHMIRNKTYDDAKIMGKYNLVLDGTRFQKAHYQISDEWLNETKEGKTTWYLSMLDLKLVANQMAISIMSEMINNEDKKKIGETEEDIKNKSAEEIKQDCELNASKRLLPNFRKRYPRLPIRIIADSLYPSIGLIELCEKENLEFIFVLRDKKIPTLLKEFLAVVSMSSGNREVLETKDTIKLTLWENDIDYKEKGINMIRQITRNKKQEKIVFGCG